MKKGVERKCQKREIKIDLLLFSFASFSVVTIGY